MSFNKYTDVSNNIKDEEKNTGGIIGSIVGTISSTANSIINATMGNTSKLEKNNQYNKISHKAFNVNTQIMGLRQQNFKKGGTGGLL